MHAFSQSPHPPTSTIHSLINAGLIGLFVWEGGNGGWQDRIQCT